MEPKQILKLVILAGLLLSLGWGGTKVLGKRAAFVAAKLALPKGNPLFEAGDKSVSVLLPLLDNQTGKSFFGKASIRQSKSRYNQMKQAVLAYLQGPHSGSARVPVPEGMGLNELYLTEQGVALVDLSVSGVNRAFFGFYEETLFVRGLIEVLSKNFFEVKQVRILVEGQDAPLLGGHYALGIADASAPASTVNAPVN